MSQIELHHVLYPGYNMQLNTHDHQCGKDRWTCRTDGGSILMFKKQWERRRWIIQFLLLPFVQNIYLREFKFVFFS
jgi:hypothetical protein